MRKILLLIVGLTALTVSCRAEVNTILEVAEDGSGKVAAEVGADDEFFDLLDTFGQSPQDLLDGLPLDTPGAETYQRTEGDLTYVGIAVEFDDIDEFTSTTGAGVATSLFTDFSFELDEDSASFRAGIDLPTDFLEQAPIDIGEITQDIFSANVIVDMPGTVVEHNATSVLADGKLRWSIPLTGGDLVMEARSDLGSAGSLWWLWVVLVAVVLFGVLITILAVVIQRRESRRAVESAAAAYPQQIAPPVSQQSAAETASGEANDVGGESPSVEGEQPASEGVPGDDSG